MASCQLRVFPGCEEQGPQTGEQQATVSVRLGELYPVLRQALDADYVWFRDFHDDEIRVTQDFYDVVRAFSSVRPSA